jgi:hypothetical protein
LCYPVYLLVNPVKFFGTISRGHGISSTEGSLARMNWKTFAIGWALALLVLALGPRPAPESSSPSGTAFVDLTYGNTVQPASSPASANPQGVPRRVVAPLVVLDVSAEVAAKRDYLVSVDDIARWEDQHGQIPPDAVVLARTSLPPEWHVHAPTTVGRFPGYSDDAVHFLVEARSVYGLGTDTPEGGRSLVLPYRAR